MRKFEKAREKHIIWMVRFTEKLRVTLDYLKITFAKTKKFFSIQKISKHIFKLFFVKFSWKNKEIWVKNEQKTVSSVLKLLKSPKICRVSWTLNKAPWFHSSLQICSLLIALCQKNPVPTVRYYNLHIDKQIPRIANQ